MLWSIKGVLNDSPAEQWGNMCHLGFFLFQELCLSIQSFGYEVWENIKQNKQMERTVYELSQKSQ